MTPEVASFVERHANSTAPAVGDLVEAIQSSSVILRVHSPSVPCDQIARTFDIRSGIAESLGHHDLASQHASLSSQCAANGGNTCTIWAFSGEINSFAVYELQPSMHIATCYRFAGPLTQASDDA